MKTIYNDYPTMEKYITNSPYAYRKDKITLETSKENVNNFHNMLKDYYDKVNPFIISDEPKGIFNTYVHINGLTLTVLEK